LKLKGGRHRAQGSGLRAPGIRAIQNREKVVRFQNLINVVLKCSKSALPCILVLISGIISAQDSFRIYPYLQNPAADAITIIWFSEDNSPGQLSCWLQGSDIRTKVYSSPVSADALVYSTWENSTFFGGMAPSVPFHHRIRIENLEPSTTYGYTVEQGTSSFSSSFKTASDRNTSIRFIVYGDSETEPESTDNFTDWIDPVTGNSRPYLIDQTTGYHNNLEVIASHRPDLIFIAGDLVESGGEQRDWDEFWRHNTSQAGEQSIGGKIPIMAALGNHEYYEGPYLDRYDQPGSERAVKRFLTYFESPANNSPDPEHEGHYYSLKYGPATFIVLDLCNNNANKSDDDTNFYLLGESDAGGGSAPDFSPGSHQCDWLEEKLIESQLNSKFTFVIFHHVPYSSGPHGFPPGEIEETDSQSGYPVRILTPLFMKHGVDAVIAGHDEIWERSDVTGFEIKPDMDEEMHTIHFFDVGTGGDGLRGPEEGLDNPDQRFLAHTDAPETWENNVLKNGGKHYGHLEVDIIPEDLNTWKAYLRPVYVFPLFDAVSSTYSGYERRTYDDEVILTYVYDNPGALSFSRSYPNPFDNEALIEYYLSEACHVKIKIFNLQGKIIRVLDDSRKDAGFYNTYWDGKDANGNIAAAGVYFYRIETSLGQTDIKRMVLLK